MPVTLPAGFTIDTQLSPDRVRVQWPGIPVGGTGAAPTLMSRTTTQFASNTTAHSVNMPATVAAGDLLIVALSCRPDSGTPTVTTPSGWTALVTGAPASFPPFRMATFYRVASGSEGGTTVNFATSIAAHMVADCFRVQAGTYQGVPTASFNEPSPSVNPGAPTHASGWTGENVLWLLGFGTNGNVAVNSYPFAGNNNLSTSGGTNNCSVVTCTTVNTTGTLGDVESMAFAMAATTNYSGFTISIRPAAAPSTSTLSNLDFESGDVNYIKGDGWAISTGGLVEAGTWSAKFTGIGQSTLAHETLAPVTAGTSITASARISKGNNRQDFAGGAVVLQWFDNTLASLGFNVGNVVNTGTSAFQTSSVTANAPTGAAYVRLAASATRDVKGRATEAVTIDTLTWNHVFTLGGTGETGGTAPTGPQTFTFRVRDANGCEAVATRTIGESAGSGLDYYSLLRFNGANGSTTFTDETGIAQTRLGSTVISTAQSRFGGSSAQFAAGWGLRSPFDLNWTQSNTDDSGNWTAEFWLYIPANITTYQPILHITSSGAGVQQIALRISGGGASTNQLYFAQSGTFGQPVPYTVPLGQWVHVAIVRNRATTDLYCDGNRIWNASGGATSMSSGAIWLGRIDPVFGAGGGFAGFIDEFRFVRTALYNGPTYTIPSAEFPYP